MTSTVTETKTKVATKQPRLFRVLLHNDDYTPMDFVVYILVRLFSKDEGTAEAIMLNIHKQGRGVAGVYTKEIAEQKVADVLKMAAHYGHPLKATAEDC